VIRLYVFCSKLERHFQGAFDLELETWNTPTEMSHTWRSPDHIRKRRRTEVGESGNGSNGGGNNGPVEVDGFRYIMKWRDEVVNLKDEKEDRVVSDEERATVPLS
jgi:hypothetical protein